MGDMTESMRGAMDLNGDVDQLRGFYDGWADGYDVDVASHDYGLPEMMLRTLNDAATACGWPTAKGETTVLDAGCGTGLVGSALHGDGWTSLSGVDLSHKMVEIAEQRGVYRALAGGVDLTVPPPTERAGAADVVTIGGVFTVGHIPPETLGHVANWVRPGGLLIASTRQAYHQETSWPQVVDDLVQAGRLELLVHHPEAPYTMDSTGDYWGFQTA